MDIADQLGISETHVERVVAELESAVGYADQANSTSWAERLAAKQRLWVSLGLDLHRLAKGWGAQKCTRGEAPKRTRGGYPNEPPLREKEEETSSSSGKSRKEKPSQDSTPASAQRESENARPSIFSSSGPDDDENLYAEKQFELHPIWARPGWMVRRAEGGFVPQESTLGSWSLLTCFVQS